MTSGSSGRVVGMASDGQAMSPNRMPARWSGGAARTRFSVVGIGTTVLARDFDVEIILDVLVQRCAFHPDVLVQRCAFHADVLSTSAVVAASPAP